MTGLLVFGKTGQVALELARRAPDAHFLGRGEADLSDPAACAAAIRAARPKAVINAAGYTAVDRAEAELALAHRINAEAPGAMAQAAAEAGIPFLQISTDYVFDGSGEAPWRETDPTAPCNAYGATKLAGEEAVLAAGGQAAILRTSWVFSAHGNNFVRTMLRLGAEREELRVVADQIGGPTPAGDIAATSLAMIAAMSARLELRGIYHYSGAPEVSWADFAREIMAQAGLSCRITPITTAEYPTPARRPANSRLDCGALARDFAIARPDWTQGLAAVLRELKP